MPYKYTCPAAIEPSEPAFEFSFLYISILTILCKKHRDCQLLWLWWLIYFMEKSYFQLSFPTYTTPDNHRAELFWENFWWHCKTIDAAEARNLCIFAYVHIFVYVFWLSLVFLFCCCCFCFIYFYFLKFRYPSVFELHYEFGRGRCLGVRNVLFPVFIGTGVNGCGWREGSWMDFWVRAWPSKETGAMSQTGGDWGWLASETGLGTVRERRQDHGEHSTAQRNHVVRAEEGLEVFLTRTQALVYRRITFSDRTPWHGL